MISGFINRTAVTIHIPDLNGNLWLVNSTGRVGFADVLGDTG